MPARRYSGLSDLAGIQYLPANSLIRVVQVDESGMYPWYWVTLPDYGSAYRWVNSGALMRSGAARQ